MKKIKLTRGKFALVDDEDYEKVAANSWYVLASGYAARDEWLGNGKKRMLYMHRVIMDAPTGLVVDHINGKKHDNRRKNLRLVTQRENGWNSKTRKDNKSGYRGVCWCKDRQKWGVRVKIGTTYKWGGAFEHVEDAARRYKQIVKKYRDAHARV